MADYGTDISTVPVVDMTGRTISGVRVVAECCLRRLTTPEGWLFYDPTFGYDLRALLNEDLDDADLRHHQLGAANQLELDERILSASVSLSLNKETFTLTVRITGTLSDASSFDFVIAIDKVSADILKVN